MLKAILTAPTLVKDAATSELPKAFACLYFFAKESPPYYLLERIPTTCLFVSYDCLAKRMGQIDWECFGSGTSPSPTSGKAPEYDLPFCVVEHLFEHPL